MDLKQISSQIRNIIYEKQKQLELTFVEDSHTYTMKGLDGELSSKFPSVSKVLKYFYDEFPTEEAAYNKAGGDPQKQEQLIAEWAAAGSYATNMGSRVHYLLEKKSVEMFGGYKEIRQPLFECDIQQMIKGDSMVAAGTKYLKLMQDRGAVLLDTETVLGHPELGYTGQPDKLWLIENKDKSDFGLFITDWKTNKPKNFESNRFTKKMKPPFDQIDDTALGHYYVQLPLYLKLFKKMLEGTEFENINIFGGIVVLLKDDSDFVEYRIPKDIFNTALEMDIKKFLISK
jgi:hypothetical protein